jgi:hypothetical protein
LDLRSDFKEEIMNMRKLFFMLTAFVMLALAACEGSFRDPGMDDAAGGGILGSGGSGGGGGGWGSGGGGGFGGGRGSGGTFTLTGIPAKYNGMYAALGGGVSDDDSDPYYLLTGFQSIDVSTSTITLSQIANGKVSIPTWVMDDPLIGFVRYSGNDTRFGVGVTIHNVPTLNDINDPSHIKAVWTATKPSPSVKFSRGGAARSWSQGYASEL